MKNPFLKKIPSAAIPADDESKRKFDKFQIGQKFEVVPWSDRSYGFLKKMISLLDIVISNNPNWEDWHFLLKVIQLDIKSVDIGLDIQGRVTQFPKSISFK